MIFRKFFFLPEESPTLKSYLSSPVHLLFYITWLAVVPSMFLYYYYCRAATPLSFVKIHTNKSMRVGISNSVTRFYSLNVSELKGDGPIPYQNPLNQGKGVMETADRNGQFTDGENSQTGKTSVDPSRTTPYKTKSSSNSAFDHVTASITLIQSKTTASKTTAQQGTHQNRINNEPSSYTARPSVSATSQNAKSRRLTKKQDHSGISVNCSEVWVSSHIGGRLGNQMCEYAHLLTLHLDYGIQVGLLSPMHKALSKIFPNLSVRLLPQECLKVRQLVYPNLFKDQPMKSTPTESWQNISSLVKNKKLERPMIIGGFPCNASVLWHRRDTWRREFTFAPTITKRALRQIQKTLANWKVRRGTNRGKDPVVVGVHVRRSDYISYLKRNTGGNVLGPRYFQRAFQWFRDKFGYVVFLIASDDRKWCKRTLPNATSQDVIVTPAGSATGDLALLSLSTHLVMSLGTYGFWAGALSHGLVAFPLNVGGRSEYFMTKNLRSINSTELIPLRL
ncbi:uncharacterized protein LOC135223332 [Macrobrachium nipponense]|uniref:uncharacterized protein LOC135223332 n=1 Tax=Macrobrachium nipponense TaxID=159736 RepID=UPI0030C7EB6A